MHTILKAIAMVVGDGGWTEIFRLVTIGGG